MVILLAIVPFPAAAAQQSTTYWHYDSAEGDTVFSLPAGLTVDRQHGLVYIVDAFGRKIFVLDGRTGQVLRSAGRKGDGPGEYLMPGAIAHSPDGGLLAVLDQGRQSVELLTPDLRPVERRSVGMLSFPKAALLLEDTTVLLSGGRMLYEGQLSSLTWAGHDGVTFSGPLPPVPADPKETRQKLARIDLAGGPLAMGRDGVLMAEAINGDVWLVGPDSKARLARGPGGVENVVEKFIRPVRVDGKSGWAPWVGFPKAIFLEEEAPNTFLLGWSEPDQSRFRFYRLRPGANPVLIRELHARVLSIDRFDAHSFIISSAAERGDFRIERRELELP